MKKPIHILWLIVLLFSTESEAQLLKPDVIASAGTHQSNATVQLSWTIGEPLILTETNGTVSLYQGFHFPPSGGGLPLSLLSFEGSHEGYYVQLNWETANELNTKKFEVYRSSDAKSWEFAGELAAAGNSTEKLAYALQDKQPLPGISYYQLKMIDLDGSFSYSNIIVLGRTITGAENTATLFPNPSYGYDANILMPKGVSGKQSILLYSLDGKLLKSWSFDITDAEEEQVVSLKDSRLFATGSYLIAIKNNGELIPSQQWILTK